MEIILLERVGKLGGIGDTVKVRNGFARNFLIPQKKAVRATDANKKDVETRRAAIEAENAELKAAAQKVAKTMEGVSVTLVRQASEDGKLYGSVNARDIAQQLIEAGHKIERKQVELNTSIKNAGVYTAKVILHAEVIVPVSVTVARNEADAAERAAVAAEALMEVPLEAEPTESTAAEA